MSSLNSAWSNLDARRRIAVIGATAAVFAAILFLARSTTSTDMSLLYAGLDNSTAGGVIAALDQQGVQYDVEGGSIFVPTASRDRLRMTLASAGLPANSSQGYELLDNLSGFGTTSQMFDAAYWRAREGELARTILSSPHIRAARVHISANTSQPFRREQAPTAAVTVTTIGGSMDTAQADALRYLVASSVPGLANSDVAVIDDVAGLIAGSDGTSFSQDAADRAAELRSRVERLLAARVGAGNAVVEVSVDTVTETESIIERRFDPETRVAISTEVQESTASSQDSLAGDVTIASNLPDGDAAGNSGSTTNENSESRAITNFEVSETQREVVRAPGAIKRISVAVMVNDLVSVNDAGEAIATPRPAEELEDLRMLVASAVGFDEARGDEITIRSMAFEALPMVGTEAGAGEVPVAPFDLMRIIQTGVLALVALILGLFVVRPILTANRQAIPLLDDSSGTSGAVINGPGGNVIDGVASAASTRGSLETDAATPSSDDPVDRLRGLIEDRREEAIQVLQSWIDEPTAEAD